MADMTEDEIKKMELELREKEILQEKFRKDEIEKLLDEAVSRGKDKALETFENERARVKAEEDRVALIEKTTALEAELKRTQEANIKKLEEMSKAMEERLQNIEGRPKGISRNDSPFQSSQQGHTPTPISQLSSDEIKAIERASMESFYSKLGRPAPY